MSEREESAGDAAPDFIPPRASRGRRSGVVLPAGPDPDAVLLEAVKAAPRRSSIIKVKSHLSSGAPALRPWLMGVMRGSAGSPPS